MELTGALKVVKIVSICWSRAPALTRQLLSRPFYPKAAQQNDFTVMLEETCPVNTSIPRIVSFLKVMVAV